MEFPKELNMERFTHTSQTVRMKNIQNFMMGAGGANLMSFDNQNKVCLLVFIRKVDLGTSDKYH